MSKYHDRFTKLIRYVESNLDLPLDIEHLCTLCGLSKYHFHRQCSLFIGLPIMSLVRLLRLKRAAYQLAFRNDKVINIALASGYESHESFSRAFKNVFRQSPLAFRQHPDWTWWTAAYEPIKEFRTKIMNNNIAFDVTVIDFPETELAVLTHHGSPALLHNSLTKFIEWRRLSKLPPHRSRTFNIVYDDPDAVAPENHRFDLCCVVEHLVEENAYGITNQVIPAGKCAVIRHIGNDESIRFAVEHLYSVWLPNSDFELREFPLYFERVAFFPERPENQAITDIYLPIV